MEASNDIFLLKTFYVKISDQRWTSQSKSRNIWINLNKRGAIHRGFPGDGRASLLDFLRAKYEGNPEGQRCKPEEIPVHPDSITQIYVKS